MMDRVFRPLPTHPTPVSEAQRLAPELPFDEIWTPEPEANLVIPGWGIAPGPAHLVTGSWYTGKTVLLATMGLAVASGRDLFGLWKVKQGKWIHFDHEMGRRQLKRYIQRLQRGLGIEPESLRGQMSLRVLPKLNLRTEGALDMYTELLSGHSICTIDPLRAAAPGADENKSEFREHLDLISIASDRTGCAAIVLHHGGKPVEGAMRKNTGRGTSAIDDAVQTKIVLTSKGKGEPMEVSMEKTRELLNPLDDFWLEFDNQPDSVRLVHRLPEELALAGAQKEQSALEGSLRRLGDWFREQADLSSSLTKTNIRIDCAMRNQDFYRAWARAELTGTLTHSRGKPAIWTWNNLSVT